MKLHNHSVEIYERSLNYLPWGSSTCSKQPKYLPDEPAVIVRGKGCRVWDADNREYIDFRNALGPVSLGYCIEEIDSAIKEELKDGIIFGYSHPLEGEVAELLCGVVPCAERARFLKTGGEAVAACIRLARHCTGRKHIIQIGYNGWLNNLGVGGSFLPGQTNVEIPPGVASELAFLHHACQWNDCKMLEDLFENYSGQIAAVVVAADYAGMQKGESFYPKLRKITQKEGALLIFDEIVTGFRVAIGGVQEYFGVIPDLAVFAKGLANGMPLSAYVGKAKFMDKLKTVVVSSTYGGETLSLAAAKAVIHFYQKYNVIEHLWKMGKMFWSQFYELLLKYGIPAEIKGVPPVSFIYFHKGVEKKLIDDFYRTIYKNGVCLYRGGYISYSHQPRDVEEALERITRGLKSL